MAALVVARNHFLAIVVTDTFEQKWVSGVQLLGPQVLCHFSIGAGGGGPFKEKHPTPGKAPPSRAVLHIRRSNAWIRSLHTPSSAVQFFIHFALESLVKSIIFPATSIRASTTGTCVFYIVSRTPGFRSFRSHFIAHVCTFSWWYLSEEGRNGWCIGCSLF